MKISDGTYTITTKSSPEVAIDANTEGGYGATGATVSSGSSVSLSSYSGGASGGGGNQPGGGGGGPGGR